ncbi:Pup--protein ligase [Corynebacterium diphtheriae]|uniref:Pup--protein ligase n=1 Tax=Corynebacterium diphtheriae bv. gravis TaxID=1720349 RepID=A0AAX0J333_CORDP|nr:Pup--protein ligase [Corynebacterium diphtheriae]OKY23532.1 Pup--protein ligase [Corynebacterium diphtheriae bv. gravis]UEB35710.1 Pup--protein ligase [Corynebacterium diphtheriae subsp. diphtheriae]UEB41935.1 Pup--protein ligase [Corynebacterium diphtheriae]UFX15204.1 Pup--protein ligase [Corynebacterium diphtheriae]
MFRKVDSKSVGEYERTVFTRRITGVETEYGITCVGDNSRRRLGADEAARYMFRPVVEEWGSSNVFIPNGARLYLDVGSHPEYASAECDSLSQLIAYDRAGDKIVDQLAQRAETALATEGIGGRVYLFKNNLDSLGNSYGCHENYLVSRDVVLKTLGRQLLPFLITRQLICGGGSIQDGQFQVSQRADHVWEGVSSATTRSRPIINTRDEPHADSHRFRRLHVIVGDSNMSETTCALKIGSTQLVLEMIEAGALSHDLELSNEIAAIREISRDITGMAPVPLKVGTSMPAIEIQRRYAEKALWWLEQRDDTEGTPNAEMHKVVSLWLDTISAIESNDLQALSRDIDWAIKLSLLRRAQRRIGCSESDFTHPKLAQLDLAYHDIRAGRGVFPVLESKQLVNRWINDTDIEQATRIAPSTTRAALRGEFLTAAKKLQAPISADWLRLKVNRPEPQIIELTDPFENTDDRVDQLINYMRNHAASYSTETAIS